MSPGVNLWAIEVPKALFLGVLNVLSLIFRHPWCILGLKSSKLEVPTPKMTLKA